MRSMADEMLVIQSEPLNVNEALMAVADDSCGGTSIFIGTTRDSFEGKPDV